MSKNICFNFNNTVTLQLAIHKVIAANEVSVL
jgi:hypothetical protein